MGRKRLHSSSADRQRAYRDRVRESLGAPLPPTRQPRQPSRPAKLAAAERVVRLVLGEYEDWLARLPESLQESAQAQSLNECIESLSSAVDLLAGITPPRGFGKD